MPIYEYRCTACQHKLESLQKFSDAPLTTCPVCGSEALTKLVSAAGFQLKGSGWYQTDFRGSGSKPAEKTTGAKSETDKSKPADATPASTTESAPAKSDAAPAATAAPTTPSGPAAA